MSSGFDLNETNTGRVTELFISNVPTLVIVRLNDKTSTCGLADSDVRVTFILTYLILSTSTSG